MVPGWPNKCKFVYSCGTTPSYNSLKLAQLLGQLGVILTASGAPALAPRRADAAAPTPRLAQVVTNVLPVAVALHHGGTAPVGHWRTALTVYISLVVIYRKYTGAAGNDLTADGQAGAPAIWQAGPTIKTFDSDEAVAYADPFTGEEVRPGLAWAGGAHPTYLRARCPVE
jgi:hypothetical protein